MFYPLWKSHTENVHFRKWVHKLIPMKRGQYPSPLQCTPLYTVKYNYQSLGHKSMDAAAHKFVPGLIHGNVHISINGLNPLWLLLLLILHCHWATASWLVLFQEDMIRARDALIRMWCPENIRTHFPGALYLYCMLCNWNHGSTRVLTPLYGILFWSGIILIIIIMSGRSVHVISDSG